MLPLDPEAAYYQAVEEFFVSRRGDPLFLSNADWHLVRKWRTRGIPLRVVLRGIGDALDAHAHGWSRERKVGSLAYCAREVEAACERWERALALGSEGGLDAPGALLGFASDLERAGRLGPRGAATASAVAVRLRERAEGGRLEELTIWLSALEEELVGALRKDAGVERVAAIDAEVDAALRPYCGRMPGPVLEQIRRESATRRLLEAHGLPRLSLFHLEMGGEGRQ